MIWLYAVDDPKRLLLECCALEQIRPSVHYNVLLAANKLSHLRLLKQLKRSRRSVEHDYFKGGTIPCFAFVASKTSDNPALTILVSFEQAVDGTVYLWTQEFHR